MLMKNSDNKPQTDSDNISQTDEVLGWINAIVRGIGTALVAYTMALFILYIMRDWLFSNSTSAISQVGALVAEFLVVGVSVLTVSYIVKVNNYIKFSRPDQSDLKIVLITVGIMLVIQVLSGIFTTVFGIESASNVVVEQGTSDPIYYLYLIPVMLIFVGPVEEYVFRGVIQSTFTRFVNFKIGIAVSSVTFGLIHLSATGGLSVESVPYIVTASLLGVVLGYYYESTDNIIVPMLAHGIYNSVLMSILFFSFQLG